MTREIDIPPLGGSPILTTATCTVSPRHLYATPKIRLQPESNEPPHYCKLTE
jgi:hypothetical protein